MLKKIIPFRKDNVLQEEKSADFVSRKFGGLVRFVYSNCQKYVPFPAKGVITPSDNIEDM